MSKEIVDLIVTGIFQTLLMTVISTVIAYIIGLPYGILLKITTPGDILGNRVVHGILGFIANVFRSIPFLILLVFLIPFTRMITGTSIGTTASIVPLTVGAIPIVARMVEASLNEISPGIVEAATSMGASPFEIVIHFMIPECLPSLLSGAAINIATILGYSAMAGCIGGGGLGAIALNYGYYRYQQDVLWVTVLILIIIVEIFQEGGTLLTKKTRKA
ncbi:MAG: ABC transporter permease [Lachnospiraceae bacterium]|nr:ABC transporter permease [Lachnospiraceae bacterium]